MKLLTRVSGSFGSGALWGHSRDAAATLTYDELAAHKAGYAPRDGTPDPATGWVEILRIGRLATAQIIYEVPCGTYYRVRMRAVNAFGAGEWQERAATASVTCPTARP